MPRIPNILALGKHCHHCGKWMQRRALRKDVACNFCNGKIVARNCKLMQLCSRCSECDNIILDNFNYCECCGLETNRQLRISKARALSSLFPKIQKAPDPDVKAASTTRALLSLFPNKQTAPDADVTAASTIVTESQDLFEDFLVDNEELNNIEESLLTDDLSANKENLTSIQESDSISSQEEEKEKNGWPTTKEAEIPK